MFGKLGSLLSIALAMLMATAVPVGGINVKLSSGDGHDFVSSQESFDLDTTTSLLSSATISNGGTCQESAAVGSGKNRINRKIAFPTGIAQGASGWEGLAFGQVSSYATSSYASLSQSLQGRGSIEASVVGTREETSTSQGAAVIDGEISTEQILLVGSGTYSSQNTALAGDAGNIRTSSASEGDGMLVAGDFDGQGDLKASLEASSNGRAWAGGKVTIAGVTCLDQKSSLDPTSERLGMSVSGLYEDNNDGLGSFYLEVIRSEQAAKVAAITSKKWKSSFEDCSQLFSVKSGGFKAYELTGWRWNSVNPQLRFYLKDDSCLRGEGLNPTAVQSAMISAANTWDECSSQNIFADTDAVAISSTAATDAYDGVNVIAWKNLTDAPSALAYSRTWYYADSAHIIDGYYSAMESDLSFNTRYNWATSGTANMDVETVALHELGHTLGLGDIYGIAAYASDTEQIMHYYTGPRPRLGNGDRAGIWELYGR
jgi:hypothetical protein